MSTKYDRCETESITSATEILKRKKLGSVHFEQARFCAGCGSPLIRHTPTGDTRERLVCAHCSRIHYVNPKVLVSCYVTWENRVLLCRRALPPAKGRWAPPSGFLEMGEALECAAVREVFEETGVILQPSELEFHGIATLTSLGEVYVHFRAKVTRDFSVPGHEALEVAFFRREEIPWEQVAFPEIAADLRLFLDEHLRSQHVIHFDCMGPSGIGRNVYEVCRKKIQGPPLIRAASQIEEIEPLESVTLD